MTLHVAVIGHLSREARAHHLTGLLDATLFLDTGNHGARWNHDRALEWGRTLNGHLLVIEDDALPIPEFLHKAADWITRHPDDLISYYLGTNYPPAWQRTVDQLIQTEADHITLPTLIHGVAYSIPCHLIPTPGPGNIDTALGKAWYRTTRRPVIYPVLSLVDHADTDSIENNGRRHQPRKARQLARPAYQSEP